MALWIPITVLAAFLQNLRSMAQRQLKGRMGTTGAAFVRFGFGMPLVWLCLAGQLIAGLGPMPGPNGVFVLAVVVGAGAQVLGQVLLLKLFSLRNFAAGTAYSRTEPVLAALFGLVLLGERLPLGAVAAIGITMAGVVLISLARDSAGFSGMIAALASRTVLVGLGSGAAFGLASVCYRAASLSLGGPNPLMQATTTLAWTITLQSLGMALWMLWKVPGEFGRIRSAWKASLFTGAMGAAASLGWFTAMTLQSAALVKAVAQVEMLFAFAASVFFFRERITGREIMGCALISGGIVALMLWI